MKFRVILAFFLILTLLTGSFASAAELNPSEMFSKRDKKTEYSSVQSVIIQLKNNKISTNSALVKVKGTTATLLGSGTYIIRGTLDDGMIIVEASKDDNVQIVLEDASITSSTSAPIYVRQADKVVITLADGTSNVLANGGAFYAIDEQNIDAALYSRDDLSLNGNGSLRIESPAGHGIVAKDDLVFASGTYEINAEGHGVSANDSVRIREAKITVNSGKDGIQAENEDDPELGFVYMESGELYITSVRDAVSSTGPMLLTGGYMYAVAGTGKVTSSTPSCKGLKSTGPMTITGGTYEIGSYDDAVHSNSDATVSGGTFTIITGDDAFHADEALLISGGDITVTQSYEGLEGHSVTVSGGKINLVTTDDGINSAGGNDASGNGGSGGSGGFGDMFAVDEDAFIAITGGEMYISAGGDGVDSNGHLTVSGGYTVVSGPTRGGNGSVDYNGTATISGGVFIAFGASDMAENFNNAQQGSILLNAGRSTAGTEFSISDENGVLLTYTADKSFGALLISMPEMVENGTYTVTIGSSVETVKLSGFTYSNIRGFMH